MTTSSPRARLRAVLRHPVLPAAVDHAILMLAQLDRRDGRAFHRWASTPTHTMTHTKQSARRRHALTALLCGLAFLLLLCALAFGAEVVS